LTPAGAYFNKAVSLLAVGENVRAWPGGTGSYKLGLNYAPGFLPQKMALKRDYDQILWLFGNNVTEAGAMNFFIVLGRDDDGESLVDRSRDVRRLSHWVSLDLDLITPPLDGTILPGLTRSSCLSLAKAHASRTILPYIPASQRLHGQERIITMQDLALWSAEGKLLEAFCVGTAVVVAPVSRIGWQGHDLVLPNYDGGVGPVARALRERILDIQEGRVEFDGWSVTC
jgi:branched-chain amino acid aminotransferase